MAFLERTLAFQRIAEARQSLEDSVVPLVKVLDLTSCVPTDQLLERFQLVAMKFASVAATKEELGVFREILDNCPDWTPKIDQLKSDHRTLRSDLTRIQQELQSLPRRQVRRQLVSWLARFRELYHRERRLLQSALQSETDSEVQEPWEVSPVDRLPK